MFFKYSTLLIYYDSLDEKSICREVIKSFIHLKQKIYCFKDKLCIFQYLFFFNKKIKK